MTSGFINHKYNRMYCAQFVSWTITLLAQLADSFLGGICISEDAVSAVGLVHPIFSIVMFVSTVFASGGSTKFSNYAGAFDKENARRSAGTGLLGAELSGIVIAVVMIFGEKQFFRFYAAGAAVEAMAREYYRYMLLTAVVYPVYLVLYDLVTIDGDEARMLRSDFSYAVGNTVFSLLLVQRLGVKGLAMGTVFALLLSIGCLVPHFFSKENSVAFSFRPGAKLIREIILSGSAVSLTSLYVGIINIVINKFVILRFGAAYLAAYTAANLILTLAEISACAADAATPFVAVSYGEKNHKEVLSILALCTRRAFLTSAGIAILFFMIAPFVPAFYGITTPEIAEASVYAARVLALSCIASGFVYEWIVTFPEIDRAGPGNLTAFVYMLAAPLIFPAAFSAFWGFKGMIWGFFLAPFAAIAATSLFIVLRYGRSAFPYAVPRNDNTVFMYEFAVNEQEISRLCQTVQKDMTAFGLRSGQISRMELVLEETLMIVKEKNPDKKQLLGDCTVIIDDNEIKLITRDNGVLFDITQELEQTSSLRHYVAARFTSTGKSAYLATISFNRNRYVWER